MATAKGQQQLRAEERREQKLADIRDQIAAGKLTVRQMTAAERELQPPPAPKTIKPKRDAPRQRGRG
ncbi:MAG: hypothetical protein ACR2KV_15150 [Solirubrobacteraceae bacterium]